MALEYAHGTIHWLAADAVNTTYQVTGLSFQPKALKFSWAGNYAAGTTDVTGAVSIRRGVGFAVDTSNRRCVGSFSENGNASADNCGVVARNDAVVCTCDGSAASDGELDLSAIASDGFTLIVDDAAPANISVVWEAWGGSDIDFAAVGDFAEPAATGNVDYTVTGFEAGSNDDQFVFFGGVQSTAALNTAQSNDSGFMIGWGGGEGLGQEVLVGNSDDGSATSDTDAYCQGGECVAMITVAGGNPSARAALTQFGTDNFRLNWLARATTSRKYIFLAIKGGRWAAGDVAINYSTLNSTADVTGLAFVPKGLNAMSSFRPAGAAGTGFGTDLVCWGCGTSTSSRRTMSSRENTSAGTSACFAAHEYDQIVTDINNVGNKPGSFDINAMNSDGFQFIVDDPSGSETAAWIGWMTWGDAPGGVINEETSTDTLGVSDLATRTVYRNRLSSDGLVVADPHAHLTYRNRRQDDAISVSDHQFRTLQRTKFSSDAITLVSDGHFRVRVWGEVASNTIDVTDQILFYRRLTRSQSDTLVVTDGTIARALRNKLSSDAISIADALISSVKRVRLSSDTISVTDAALRYLIRGRVASDALDVVDSFIKQLVTSGAIFVKTSTDSIEVLDQNLRALLRIRLREDAIVLSDNRLHSVLRQRTVSEALTVIDALLRSAVRKRVSSDALLVADGSVFTVIRNRLMIDAVNVSDAISTARLLYRALSDSLDVVDGFIKAIIGGAVLFRTSTDAITVTDEFVRRLYLTRRLDDGVTVMDEFIKSVTGGAVLTRTSTDAIAVTDSYFISRNYGRLSSDTLVVADEVLRFIVKLRQVSDSFDVTDNILSVRLLTRSIADLLDVTDSFDWSVVGPSMLMDIHVMLGVQQQAMATLGVDRIAVLGVERQPALSVEQFVRLGTDQPQVVLGAYN